MLLAQFLIEVEGTYNVAVYVCSQRFAYIDTIPADDDSASLEEIFFSVGQIEFHPQACPTNAN